MYKFPDYYILIHDNISNWIHCTGNQEYGYSHVWINTSVSEENEILQISLQIHEHQKLSQLCQMRIKIVECRKVQLIKQMWYQWLTWPKICKHKKNQGFDYLIQVLNYHSRNLRTIRQLTKQKNVWFRYEINNGKFLKSMQHTKQLLESHKISAIDGALSHSGITRNAQNNEVFPNDFTLYLKGKEIAGY